MKLRESATFSFSKFENRSKTEVLAAISNFGKYRNYWFFGQNSMKSCVAGKFDARFEKLVSFYVRKLSLKKKRGGVCLRKIALKVV